MSINERPNYAKTETRVEGTNMFDSILNSYKASTQGLLDTTKQLGAAIDNWNPSNSGGSSGTNSDGNTGGTGSSTTGLTPEQFQALLEQFGKIKTEGEGSGAMDFATYLRLYGSDTQKNFEQAMEAARANYGKSVKAANDAYYRSLMTYGQNAEALSAGGLMGAGVSNYGDHAAYAARQGAVATAGAVQQQALDMAGAAKQQADVENERAFFEYLQDYKANEEAKAAVRQQGRYNTLTSIMQNGVTDVEQISALLRASGYFDENEIDGFATQYAGFASVNTADTNVAAATDWYNNAIAGGMTPEAAKLQLEQTYGVDIANTVAGNVNAVNNTDIVTQINNLNGTGFLSDAKTTLDAAKNAGFIKDDAEYNSLLTKIQTNNANYLNTLLGISRNEFRMGEVIEKFGIELGEDADDEEVMKAAVDAVKQEALNLFYRGDISTAQAVDVLEANFQYDVDAILDDKQDKDETNLRDLCDRITEVEQFSEQLGDGAMLEECIKSLGDKITVKKDTIAGMPFYNVTFGEKTMSINGTELATIKKSKELGLSGNVKAKVFEANQIADLATLYSLDQAISLIKIIETVLGEKITIAAGT